MRHRVRAAVLIVRPESILLVGHRSAKRPGFTWWLPPGGGLEAEDASIFACAQREALEEAGLTVAVSRIAYVHEFVDKSNGIRHVAFYMAVDSVAGEVSLQHLPPDVSDAQLIFETRWVSRQEVRSLNVYPEYLKTEAFWQEAVAGFPEIRYLGVMTEL